MNRTEGFSGVFAATAFLARLVLILVGVVLIVGCIKVFFFGIAPQAKAPTTQAPRKKVERVYQEPEPLVSQTPISMLGYGQQATNLYILQRGLRIFTFSYTGSGNFVVWLIDEDGERIDLVANEIGTCSGSKATQIRRTGKYLLDVMADGGCGWRISIK